MKEFMCGSRTFFIQACVGWRIHYVWTRLDPKGRPVSIEWAGSLN